MAPPVKHQVSALMQCLLLSISRLAISVAYNLLFDLDTSFLDETKTLIIPEASKDKITRDTIISTNVKPFFFMSFTKKPDTR